MIGDTLMMFGGFDGHFYNDMHFIDVRAKNKFNIIPE